MMDIRIGSPYDRGASDSYYRRGEDPHYYVNPDDYVDGTCISGSGRIDITDKDSVEYYEYMLGYENNERKKLQKLG